MYGQAYGIVGERFTALWEDVHKMDKIWARQAQDKHDKELEALKASKKGSNNSVPQASTN